jgi:hypothetical protein
MAARNFFTMANTIASVTRKTPAPGYQRFISGTTPRQAPSCFGERVKPPAVERGIVQPGNVPVSPTARARDAALAAVAELHALAAGRIGWEAKFLLRANDRTGVDVALLTGKGGIFMLSARANGTLSIERGRACTLLEALQAASGGPTRRRD